MSVWKRGDRVRLIRFLDGDERPVMEPKSKLVGEGGTVERITSFSGLPEVKLDGGGSPLEFFDNELEAE